MSDTLFRYIGPENDRERFKDQAIGLIGWVEIDYEAMATRLQKDDDMAGHFVASLSEYERLARSYAETLGIEGDESTRCREARAESWSSPNRRTPGAS
jgi:hypothetical protein